MSIEKATQVEKRERHRQCALRGLFSQIPDEVQLRKFEKSTTKDHWHQSVQHDLK